MRIQVICHLFDQHMLVLQGCVTGSIGPVVGTRIVPILKEMCHLWLDEVELAASSRNELEPVRRHTMFWKAFGCDVRHFECGLVGLGRNDVGRKCSEGNEGTRGVASTQKSRIIC